jgi:oligopeptide/dipeptide ABC transporter ATP-binding protein
MSAVADHAALSEYALSITDLEVQYVSDRERVMAVRGVNLDLPRSRKLAIVGESGCGKSTLALAMLRLVEPPGVITGGDISINGRSILSLSDKALADVRGNEVALIFQDPSAALDPVKRIGGQVAEVIDRHTPGLSKHELRARAQSLLESVEMPSARDRLKAYPHELSGGLRQRVVIAIALANSPDVLIADEPTSALDVTTQAQIMDLLNRLVGERGTGVVLITHNLGLVAEFCDSVAVMYAGRIVEQADVDSIFAAPVHPYTDALLRCVPTFGLRKDGRLPALPGFPPNLTRIPMGCSFEPRCPVGMGDERCRTRTPVQFRLDSLPVPTMAECHYAEARAARGGDD